MLNFLKKYNFLSIIWFIIGFSLFIFTRTITYVPIAIFAAPIFILHFIGSRKLLKSIALIIAGFTISITISLWKLFSFDDKLLSLIFNLTRNIILALIIAIPYIFHSLLKNRVKGFISTLIFPISAVTFYFLNSSFGPFDGTGIFFAYNQPDKLVLNQLMSIAGIWGMVFFISWFASVINWIWENNFNIEKIKNGVIIYICISCSILLFGGFRTSPFFYPKKDTVRIAAITLLDNRDKNDIYIEKTIRQRIFSPIDKTMTKIEKLVSTAVKSGAKIIVSQEMCLFIKKSDESKLIEKIKNTAKENNVYIAICYDVLPEKGKGKNKCLFVNNNGDIEVNYEKHNLHFAEKLYLTKGKKDLPVINTPYGKIGITICRDMELPEFARIAGRKNADIVLSPALDFPGKILPAITYNQMLRSVENGFSIVRCVNNGLSIAVDYHGRIISSMNYFTATNEIMYADVPVKGVKTIYSIIGDLFAWLCAAAFIGYVILALITKIMQKRNT